MAKRDTGMGGSGYPSEFASVNPKTKRIEYNNAQWKKQRGSAGPDAEFKEIISNGKPGTKLRAIEEMQGFKVLVNDAAQARELQRMDGKKRTSPSSFTQIRENLKKPASGEGIRVQRLSNSESKPKPAAPSAKKSTPAPESKKAAPAKGKGK